jgi:translation initiation factor IF-2
MNDLLEGIGPMSTKQQHKQKLNELAKDLNISSQELIDFIKEKLDVEKKASASLENEEVNRILEIFTLDRQVDSFNEYFALRNKPATKPVKEEPKPQQAEKKKPVNKAKAKDEAAPVQSNEQPKQPVNNTEPVKKSAEHPAQVKNTQQPEKPVQQPVKKPEQNKQSAEIANKAEQKSQLERFNNQLQKATEQKNKQQNNSVVEQKQPVQQKQQTVKTKLTVNIADTPVRDNKIHTVDTRGFYVEMDKYNEKYENIAPTQGGKRKDNYTKKQKLTQKSAQRNKQQYSSRKETETEKLRRLELERARKQQLKVLIPDEIVVSELASRLKVTASQVIKKLVGLGEMRGINDVIDFDTASLVAEELGARVEKEIIVTIEERLIDDSDDDGEGVERAPVVVVMGHVDHGKTSLLDKIRNSNVTATEAGGITQHIGAYRVNCNGKEITFLDTPGHEAFTSMRARGASVTDIAILVVAADDGIMPQTVEAINHAKAAGVSIIVAINKMDKEGANPDAIKQQLTEYNLVAEEWGGDVICVPVSAKTGEGIDELLENVILVAEVAELKANPNRLAKGTVIEARLDKGRGPIATILIQNGTLHTGDIIIAGTAVGRVRVMTNDKGQIVTEAGPSYPVEITGLAEVPSAGDVFNAVEDEKLARELVEQRKHEAKQEQFKQYQKVTLDNLFSQIEQGEIKELPIIVKADVQGSVEAVKQSLEKISNDEVRVKVIHGGVGAVSESDVMLANASNAIIVGFNVRPDPVAAESAARDGVDIRLYRIIYDAIEEITTAMKGMLAPKFREVEMGRIEVRQVYKISNVGIVSGSYVLSGKVARNCQIRVVRDGIIIAVDKMSSLKRFKDDAKEVAEGYECGITLEKFSDVKEGDIFEAFIVEEYRAD